MEGLRHGVALALMNAQGGATDALAAGTPRRRPRRAGKLPGRQDWSSWPHYQAAAAGFRGYWYPVCYSSQLTGKPKQITLLGEKIVLIRDGGTAYALKDRCPHRGVPLSEGNQQFPGTISCPYHGWTFDLETGELKAVITDGPESPDLRQGHPADLRGRGAARHGVGLRRRRRGRTARSTSSCPRSWSGTPPSSGRGSSPASGNWRFACENGYDEGHAKYLHRTSLWRLFKADAGVERDPDRAARTLDLPRAGQAVLGPPISPASASGTTRPGTSSSRRRRPATSATPAAIARSTR